jgi:hypothetical protein
MAYSHLIEVSPLSKNVTAMYSSTSLLHRHSIHDTCMTQNVCAYLDELIQVGLGLMQRNVHIQWNPVYKAFHRIHFCGNEPNGQ